MSDDIISPENLVYARPELMNDTIMRYCPDCSHSVAHKLVVGVIAEMQMEEKAVGVCPVGYAVLAYRYLNIGWQETPHGRAPVVATAVKRLWPDRLVLIYRGDGDLACIGTAELIHTLNGDENIAMIFINNVIHGTIGGQMAPTTLLSQKTSTCPYGRDPKLHGYLLNITELASKLEGTYYITQQSVDIIASIRQTKEATRKAFATSMGGKGSSFVEVVNTCSSGWKVLPARANEWIRENMFDKYPKDDLRDNTGL